MITLTKSEKDIINRLLNHARKVRALEMKFSEILEKYDIDGDGYSAGAVSNCEVNDADEFIELVNEFD